MNKKELVLIDIVIVPDKTFEIDPTPFGYALSMLVSNKMPLEYQLKNRTEFTKCMKEAKKESESFPDTYESEVEKINYFSSIFDNLLNEVDYIRLNFSKIDPLEFIKNNPYILNNKVVIDDPLDINDFDKLKGIMRKYEGLHDKLYIYLTNNSDYVTLKDCYETLYEIEKNTEDIKNLGLSPMETIMCVYDVVKSNIYTPEGEGENPLKSRDITSITKKNNESIVCVGFANKFDAYLRKLGFMNSHVVYLDEINNPALSHARNAVYVKDTKYNIDGYYYFDTTFDSKASEEDFDFIDNYSYFAKSLREMLSLDEDDGYEFVYKDIPGFSFEMADNIRRIIKKGSISNLDYYRTAINRVCGNLGIPSLIDFSIMLSIKDNHMLFDGKEFMNKFNYIFSKYDKQIPAEVMIRLLNNVRKVEYQIDNNLCNYSYQNIKKIFKLSNWKFKDIHLTPEDRLLRSIFEGEHTVTYDDYFDAYAREIDLNNSINEVVNAKKFKRDKSN